HRVIKVLYDDPWLLVVDKPAGMLSVPGRIDATSVWKEMQHNQCCNGLIAVHRLDMDTSGVLVFAKDINTYRALQRQFARREVRKTYIAVLEGFVAHDSGTIELPLHADPLHRPRQCVDFDQGKPAVTDYRVVKCVADTTTVEFTPHTGRTHQLRVHAAHRLGLNAPIVGDRLYGRRPSTRLYLHALRIELQHPVTGDLLAVESPLPWKSE
ncbi:MAG: RluA family pseudouridine synthase, partial [Muribaculaceae bacterium]